MEEKINYYDLLNVKMDATDEEIKKAYRNMIKKWHPDLNKDSKAVEITSKLNDAKNILLDKDKRKEYDDSLKNVKKDVYENLDRKQYQRENKSKYQENKEEKLYTKWEYFKLYLKYYNVSIIRKIIATIFVFIETILCFILDMVNVILAYFIIYTYDILKELLIVIGCILFLIFGMNILENKDVYNINMFMYLITGILSLVISIILPLIVRILLNKNPIYISKLNMFLFKVAIGYK